MTKRNILNISFAFLMTMILTSCNGQVKNNSAKEQTNIIKTEKIGYPKFKTSHWAKDHDGITASLKDSKGNLWFGTSGGGVYCYDGKLFRQYTIKDGLSHDAVGAIYEDTKGIIWLGTSDGITTWDGNKFTKIPMTTLRGFLGKPYQPTTKDMYGFVSQENEVNDIIQDSKGDFWFAAYKAVYRYDGKTFTHFTVNDGIKNNSGVEFDWIERIIEDKEGKIWFGGRGSSGLFCYDGKVVTNIQPKNTDWAKSSGYNFLVPRSKDNNGNILFSNWAGLYSYDGKTFETFAKKNELCSGNYFGAFKDKAGNLWLEMDNRENGCGICKYDGKTFEYFPITIGATENIAGTIVEDNEGNLWVGVNDGELYRFDGKNFTLFSE
jgi:ligand-binding sensor domain-containing protein